MTRTRKSLFILIPLLLLAFSAWGAEAPPESVCLQCHGSLPDRLGAPVNLWKKSVHAQNGISCNGCHGGDPNDAPTAMTPAKGFLGAPKETAIPAFCGRCHPGVLKDYLSSAHGRALGKGGPTCVTCHGNHEVLKATLALINEKSCSRCHSFERARVIRDAMQQTEAHIQAIEARLGKYQSIGVDTERLGKELFSIRNGFHSLFHEVNTARVKSESGRINAELSKLDRELQLIDDEQGRRRVVGGIAVAVLLALAFLAYLLRKTFRD